MGFYPLIAFHYGGGFPDAYINDPISIGRKALSDLSDEVGLPNAINELESILNTNTNYAHQAILNEAKDNRSVVVNGETFQDLKTNPKYSSSGSATIEEIEAVLKKEQVEMMRSRASGLPTSTPESLGAPSAAKVQGTVGEAKAEDIVSHVTSEPPTKPTVEAVAETISEPTARGSATRTTVATDAAERLKTTASATVKSAREAAAKATDAVGVGIGKVKNFGAKEGAIGAGIAAAAAVLTFRNT